MKKTTIRKGYETPSTTTLYIKAEAPVCASGDFEDAGWTDPITDITGDIDFIF